MNIYAGLFAIAFSALSLEVTLVRLLSVTTWYHLAFFAISVAMLGMTAGATRVYLRPQAYGRDEIDKAVSASCIHFALSIPVTLLLLCLIPLELHKSAMSVFSFVIATAACALPFYFAGIVISAVLTKHSLPMGKLYASDLIGASMGCLFVLGGLEFFDAPSLILLCGCTGAAAALCFAWKMPSGRLRRLGIAVLAVFLIGGVVNSLSATGIRPLIVKGTWIEHASDYLVERWNSYSRVVVYKQQLGPPQYWGRSPLASMNPVYQYRMNIDGMAGTTMQEFKSMNDIDHLKYDVTNIAYYLRQKGKACVIGVGAGRDVQSALLFGHDRVVGIEINPIFVKLLEEDFRDFAGLADRPEVDLVTAEARSYLSASKETYSVIQMSLIDTWASTGAGAFSLSENSLYTVEAWGQFLDRLEEYGVFTVSRWHSPQHFGETGRVLSTAVAALLRHGAREPSEHLALVSAGAISTLVMSREPFRWEDMQKLATTCKDLRFEVILLPGHPPDDRLLFDIVSARTQEELSSAVAGAELNLSPATDESPYFFNMLRLSKIRSTLDSGVVSGNIVATLTVLVLLLALFVFAIATIILPLSLRTHFGVDKTTPSRTLWSGVVYFSLIGAGFMLTEIALIQRLTVLLSHPLHALGILLFALIASTGIGSLLSDRLPLTRTPWLYVYPLLTAGCLMGLRFLLSALLSSLVVAPLWSRIAVSVAVVFPVGLLMGVFFPTGMRIAKSISSAETPWYWALNGIFGVLCSAIAVLISIYVAVSANFYIAAICYGAVIIAQRGLHQASARSSRAA